MKKNLLKEVQEVLELHGKTIEDVLYIGTLEDGFFKPSEGLKSLDIFYNDSWTGCVNPHLLIVGDNWWLSREADNDLYRIWWQWHQKPEFKPATKKIDLLGEY